MNINIHAYMKIHYSLIQKLYRCLVIVPKNHVFGNIRGISIKKEKNARWDACPTFPVNFLHCWKTHWTPKSNLAGGFWFNPPAEVDQQKSLGIMQSLKFWPSVSIMVIYPRMNSPFSHPWQIFGGSNCRPLAGAWSEIFLESCWTSMTCSTWANRTGDMSKNTTRKKH